jgi:hypothetical protein
MSGTVGERVQEALRGVVLTPGAVAELVALVRSYGPAGTEAQEETRLTREAARKARDERQAREDALSWAVKSLQSPAPAEEIVKAAGTFRAYLDGEGAPDELKPHELSQLLLETLALFNREARPAVLADMLATDLAPRVTVYLKKA